jgi:uncharacterized protein
LARIAVKQAVSDRDSRNALGDRLLNGFICLCLSIRQSEKRERNLCGTSVAKVICRKGERRMIAIEEMSNGQIKEVLRRVGYGHLGMARGSHPYVVPIHYTYNDPYIYIYTTEGKKTEIIRDNPEVCLQVEEIRDDKDWQSVIATGEAVRITDREEREHALKFILAANPTLTPALSIRWMDSWVRENIEVVYRILPRMLTGRATIEHAGETEEFSLQEKKRKSTIY